MFTDKAFNKICKLKEGTKTGEFYVISALCKPSKSQRPVLCVCVKVLTHHFCSSKLISAVLKSSFPFLTVGLIRFLDMALYFVNRSSRLGPVLAFSHLRLCAYLYPTQTSNSMQSLDEKDPLVLAIYQCLFWCASCTYLNIICTLFV